MNEQEKLARSRRAHHASKVAMAALGGRPIAVIVIVLEDEEGAALGYTGDREVAEHIPEILTQCASTGGREAVIAGQEPGKSPTNE